MVNELKDELKVIKINDMTAEKWNSISPEQRHWWSHWWRRKGKDSFCCLECGFPTHAVQSGCVACRPEHYSNETPLRGREITVDDSEVDPLEAKFESEAFEAVGHPLTRALLQQLLPNRRVMGFSLHFPLDGIAYIEARIQIEEKHTEALVELARQWELCAAKRETVVETSTITNGTYHNRPPQDFDSRVGETDFDPTGTEEDDASPEIKNDET